MIEFPQKCVAPSWDRHCHARPAWRSRAFASAGMPMRLLQKRRASTALPIVFAATQMLPCNQSSRTSRRRKSGGFLLSREDRKRENATSAFGQAAGSAEPAHLRSTPLFVSCIRLLLVGWLSRVSPSGNGRPQCHGSSQHASIYPSHRRHRLVFGATIPAALQADAACGQSGR